MTLPDQSWRQRAACQGHDTLMFFAPEGRGVKTGDARKRIAQAVSICAGCPVQAECAHDADRHHDVGCVRGGRYRRVPKGHRW